MDVDEELMLLLFRWRDSFDCLDECLVGHVEVGETEQNGRVCKEEYLSKTYNAIPRSPAIYRIDTETR